MSKPGINQKSTKLQNKSLVLKTICTNADITRIDIAKKTGLSKMSITNIVNELIEERYVIDRNDKLVTNSVGRNPIILSPDLSYHTVLGLYISRDFITGIITGLNCEILYQIQVEVSSDETGTTFIDKIKDLVSRLIRTARRRKKHILSIGVASIGPLDLENGTILRPPNFHRISSIPITEILRKEFGYPVTLNNDMNASALAEKLFGDGKNYSDFIYLGITNGIGSGIISHDIPFYGSTGFSGEVGHITIDYNGPVCSCGNSGCLELYASIPKIIEEAKNAVSQGTLTSLSDCPAVKWKDIVTAASRGDAFSLELLDRTCFYISIALVSLINLYDPQIIYLGHEFALAGELVTQRLNEAIRTKTISHEYKPITVAISSFQDKAPVIGSAALALEELFHLQ